MSAVVRKLCDSPVCVALAALLLYGGFVAQRLSDLGWDVSRFIVCGDEFCDPALVPPGIHVETDSSGYDGQFYYRLALSPSAREEVELGIRIDEPAYRRQRILYPLLVHGISLGGRPLTAAWGMVGVNLAALATIAYLGARYARSVGLAAGFGLVAALFPGFLLSLVRDLTEIVAVALLFGGLVAYLRRRCLAAGVLFGLAVLARETSILMLGAVGIVEALRFLRVRDGVALRRTAIAIGVPLAVFGAWQAILANAWGVWPMRVGGGNVGAPFAGMMSFVEPLFQSGRGRRVYLIHVIFLVSMVACTLAALVRSKFQSPALVCGWIAYLALALCATRAVWCEPWSAIRTLAEFSVLTWMLVIGSRDRLVIGAYSVALAVYWILIARSLA